MESGITGEDRVLKIFGRLACFVEERAEAIRSDWLDAVRDEVRLRISERLEDPLIIDHLPMLLEDIGTLFRSGCADGLEPEASAHLHGQHRWEQGYRLEEVVLELALLRSVFIRHLADFSATSPEFTGEVKVNAIIHLHRFFDASMWFSAQRFVDEQQAELREANSARLRLIGTVSHELRNIINAMGLTAQSVEAFGAEALEELPEMLGRNVQQMREILDDLLELSALSCGRESVKAGTFALGRLLHDIEVAYRPLAEEKGLRLISELDPELSDVVGDELKTKQIIANLVSNAVKYTEAGEVRINFRSSDAAHWVAVVTDTGVGISKDHQEQIFSEFYRVDETSRVEGMGLGLAISTRLAQLLGGEVKLISEQGKGSTFEVILPRVYSHETAQAVIKNGSLGPAVGNGRPQQTYMHASGTS